MSAFERRGAEVLHAPALRIAPHEQDEQLLEETRALVAARPDVVLVTTGYGVRRWFEVADAAGLGTELTEVLDEAHVMARGPKALGAVRAAGLEHVRTTVHESTEGMVDELAASGGTYRCVAVQLHGYTDETRKYAWAKVYNADAFAACSNMPRFGHHHILTEQQIRDVVALLVDPASPVNQ